MDILQQAILSMDQDDRDSFRAFLSIQKDNAKYLLLFDILRKGKVMKPVEIISKLYKTNNANAYHSLRKRLYVKLTDYIAYRKISSANSSGVSSAAILVAEYLIDHHAANIASQYLSKAESEAIKSQNYTALSVIYTLQIRHAHDLGISLESAITKWEANSQQLRLAERLFVAQSLIREQLLSAKKSGTILDLDMTVNSVFTNFDITREAANNAEFMYAVCNVVRSAVISTKGYHKFEPFIARIYKRLDQAQAFGKDSDRLRLGFLYMLSHVVYRNKRFDEAETWLLEMEALLRTKSQAIRKQFLPKYYLLKGAVLTFSGKNEEAIEVLNTALSDKKMKFDIVDEANMRLNLSVYYFQSADYKKANKAIIQIGHADHWLEKKLGKEWRFKKNMIEVIIQYELGNVDIAMSRIESIEKYFADFLSQPLYQRAKSFIRFIKILMQSPEIIPSKEFQKEVEDSNMALPTNQEDIQAITFFCWLKSKMIRKPYYFVLLEALNRIRMEIET